MRHLVRFSCSVFGSQYLPLATAITPEKSPPEFKQKNESQFHINQFKVRKSLEAELYITVLRKFFCLLPNPSETNMH